MTTLSVVIPAYNEADGIEFVIQRVLGTMGTLEKMGVALELVIVDDGSRDKTASVVGQFPKVRLIRHIENRGYGAAIKTGFRHASGEYLAILDADGTYPPEKLPDLWRTAVEQKADLVVGSRMSGARSEMPLTRRVGNLAYSILLSLIGSVRVRDTTSGMRLIRKEILEALYPLPDGLDFTTAMSTRAVHEDLKIIEVPIPYAERIGRSKLSVVRDGFRFTNTIVWTAMAYNPVRILGLGSLVMLGIAAAIGLYILALRLSGVTTLNPWQVYALFGASVMAFGGISLFSLGAMFNYLVALFHKRPARRGLFGKPIFDPPLDHHFGWMGFFSVIMGTVLATVVFIFSLNGWGIERLWFYLLGTALLVIIGIQLSISWLVMRVLEGLAQREGSAKRDLIESEPINVKAAGVAWPHTEASNASEK